MIKRAIVAKVKELAQKYPVIAITGPRQSGKTTLAKDVFSGYDYHNLENIDTLNAAQSDPRNFIQTGSGKKMIIDEAQRLPELFSYIQAEVDEQKIDGQFVITGSQQFGMTEKLTQSLAGRVANFILLPLSLSELSSSEYSLEDAGDYMVKGFYPRLYDKNVSPGDYFRDYVFTYLERDVRQIKNIGDISTFQRFIQLTAGRVGQIVNLTSLANDTGVSYKTIESWLSVLEASYIIFRLQPYFRNYGKRVIKSPKLYFYDTGLLSFLLGVDSVNELGTHFAQGQIFENLVIADIAKKIFNKRANQKLYYWRENNGNEVDLIIDEGAKQNALEIKLGKTFKPEFLKGLDFWKNLDSTGHEKSFLVYSGDINQKVRSHHVINWKDYLLER